MVLSSMLRHFRLNCSWGRTALKDMEMMRTRFKDLDLRTHVLEQCLGKHFDNLELLKHCRPTGSTIF